MVDNAPYCHYCGNKQGNFCGDNLEDKLRKLLKLKEEGLITPEEYRITRRNLVNEYFN